MKRDTSRIFRSMVSPQVLDAYGREAELRLQGEAERRVVVEVRLLLAEFPLPVLEADVDVGELAEFLDESVEVVRRVEAQPRVLVAHPLVEAALPMRSKSSGVAPFLFSRMLSAYLARSHALMQSSSSLLPSSLRASHLGLPGVVELLAPLVVGDLRE